MLDAVLSALASDERDVRLDAYFTLLRTLGAHKNVPEAETLRPKAAQLVQYILRDTSTVNSNTNAPDSQLTGEACKLLSVLFRVPGVTEALGDDTCNTILKKCILSIEDLNASKAIVRHNLFLLAEQRFSPRVMTVERVDRVLHVLQKIDERYPGNSVVAMRLLIFKRLAEQCADYMGVRVDDWLEHIFHGMLSSLDEIRNRAIDAGTTIALATGHNSETSKALMTLFSQQIEDGTTYGDYVSERLLSMVTTKSKAGDKLDTRNTQQARHVPQIWAVGILLFRARNDRLTTWSHFKLWLNIISQCFNSSDIQTKFHASVAWNRLVYVLMPSASTEPKLYNMLKQPMTAQLGTKGLDKFAVAIRKYALGSYCNLLHYAFRPNATSQDCSKAWEEFVPPLLELLTKRSDVKRAMEVVRALMSSGTTNLWKENRANEPPFVLEVQDLPHLEPLWIRQNIGPILNVLEPMLHYNSDLELTNTESPTMLAWKAILQAISEAGGKEITTSKELKAAIARLLDFFVNTWPSDSENLSHSVVARQLAFGTSVVEILGPRLFNEVVLKRRVAGQAGAISFEVINTPSLHRSRGSLDSALGHIIRFLCATRARETELLCNAAAKHLITICTPSRVGLDQDFEALMACVSDMTSRIRVSAQDDVNEEVEDEAEPPRAPQSLRSPFSRLASASPSPMRSARRSKPAHLLPHAQALRKTTPTKLRHQDSQIEFAAIHSSPPEAECGDESQHLTAHQKEVRERQQDDAAGIFSDLSATPTTGILQGPSVNVNRLPPRPSSASRMQEKLRSSAMEETEESDRPSTPPLPLPDIGMSDDLAPSSPVRDASERRSQGSQRSSSSLNDQPAHLSTAVKETFLDVPASSPPHYDGEQMTQNTKEPISMAGDGSNAPGSFSVDGDDDMFDTATEIADEIIERTKSADEEQETVDPSKAQIQGEARDVLSQDKGHDGNDFNADASTNDDALAAEPLSLEPDVSECSPAKVSQSTVPSVAEAERSQIQAQDTSSVKIPKTSSPTCNTISNPTEQARDAVVQDTDPDTSIMEVTDLIAAAHVPEPASSQSPSGSMFDETGPVDRSTTLGSQQGVKRKIGRPRKHPKLEPESSMLSVSSQGTSPSSQGFSRYKFYTNDDSDVEEHITVRTPVAKPTTRRARGRPSKHAQLERAQTVPSRPAGSDQGSLLVVNKRLARSVSAMSETSVSSPLSKRRRITKSDDKRSQASASQLSSATTDDEDDNGGMLKPSRSRKVVPLVQVARTPVDAPRDDGWKCNGNKNHQDTPDRKRKREPSIDDSFPSPADERTSEAANEGNRTPIQPKVQTPSTTPSNSVRSILSPAGLLRGLRGILDGCRNAVMGTQEEREVDDMLFQIRREVHEAGRRAKKRKV